MGAAMSAIITTAAPRASRGTYLKRIVELTRWRDELDKALAQYIGSASNDYPEIRELADRIRVGDSLLAECRDWTWARSRLESDARAEGVTVAKALQMSARECEAAGLKATQKFSRWLCAANGLRKWAMQQGAQP
jgi:hypothetical protein